GLALPPGYVLPSDTRLAPREATPDLLPTRAYGLADLIDIAQSANPSTRRAWNAARDAALGVGIARSALLPRLTASVVGGYNNSTDSGANPSISNAGTAGDVANAGLNGLTTATGGVSNRTHGAGEVQTLGLEWLLFDFGAREATIDAARHAQIASNVLFTAAHQKVIYTVATAYYTHAAATARVGLLRQGRDNAQAVLAAAQARLQQGQGTIVDVAQARQATAQAELRLVQADGDAQNTLLDLLNAVGISPETPLRTADVGGRPLGPEAGRLSHDMVRQAVARRPDVLAAYATADAARAQVSAARRAFLPKIFATGNVAYSTGRLALSSVPGVGSDSTPTLNLSSNRFSSVILGGITVPIFDGGTRAALLRQAQDRADSADATLRQTRDESVKQIVVAENSLHTGLSAYAASAALLDASRVSYEAAFAAYRNGAGSITQATVAQNGLLDATLARSDAYYAALIAAASLAFATGALGDAGDVPLPR
ncbi:TolC family protein, partial [Ameyamaea chiangmaiensis]